MGSNCSSKFSIMILLLTISTRSFFSSASTPPEGNSNDVQECTQSLVGLATCLPYVGETARSPTPDCCSGLKQVLRTNRKCLCVIIKDRNDPNLGLNINVTLALGLPLVCHAPANISECPALLNLPPDSPDAQLFYPPQKQLNNNNATSPTIATVGPTTSAGRSPEGSSTQQQRSHSFRVGSDNLAAIALIWGAIYYSNLS